MNTTNVATFEEIEETVECRECEEAQALNEGSAVPYWERTIAPINADSGLLSSVVQSYHKVCKDNTVYDDEEIKKLGKLAAGGDKAAVTKIVESTMYIAVTEAKKKYRRLGRIGMAATMGLEDLIQSGIEGILEAITRMDWDSTSCKFSTYATYWVANKINTDSDQLCRGVHIPKGRVRDVTLIKKASDAVFEAIGERPTVDELYVYFDGTIRKERIKEAIRIMGNTRMVSIDAETSAHEGEKDYRDLLEDTESERPGEALEKNELLDALQAAIGTLSKKELTVIEYTYGLNGKKVKGLRDLPEILKAEGICNRAGEAMSHEGVRLIKQNAFKKLRRELKSFGVNSRLESIESLIGEAGV